MWRLHPGPVTELDADSLARAHHDPARRRRDLPWLCVNMISTLDGAISVDGTSGALGGPGDHACFELIRAQADVVMVGAGTFRAERYSTGPRTEEVLARRRSNGVDDLLRLAIITSSADLDLDQPSFTDSPRRPLVITTESADPGRLADVADVADVIVAGRSAVELPRALAELGRRGIGVVLSEGGPHVNGQLVELDLLDEVFLTISPAMLGGPGDRMAVSPDAGPLRSMELAHVLRSDSDELMLRYLRRRSAR